jgi:hypothetical protein
LENIMMRGRRKNIVTPSEKELVAALEADIQMWEVVAGHYERLVGEIQTIDGQKITGRAYAATLRKRAAEHRELVDKVKKR